MGHVDIDDIPNKEINTRVIRRFWEAMLAPKCPQSPHQSLVNNNAVPTGYHTMVVVTTATTVATHKPNADALETSEFPLVGDASSEILEGTYDGRADGMDDGMDDGRADGMADGSVDVATKAIGV